ncbi:hypothetical protein BDY24DRAFT_415184 [Mrakia frigida]|uniref:uncharacterized protein n=1 Tax=Mrakia frigida TaxID=29902 RepID=UPI003FCBF043
MSQYHPPSYARYQPQPAASSSSSSSIPRNSLLLSSSHSSVLDEDDLSFSIAPRTSSSRPPPQSGSASAYQQPSSASSSYYQQSQSQAWSMVVPTRPPPPPPPSSASQPSSLMPMPGHDGLGNFASPSGLGNTDSQVLWEEDSFSGTETDLGGGGWSQISLSADDLDAASSSSGSSGGGGGGGGRRRDYREKRTRGRIGSSSTMSVGSSLLDTEGLSEMSLSPPSLLDVEVDEERQRTTSMSRVPTLLALHQQPTPTHPIPRSSNRLQPSGNPPLQPHSQTRTLIDSERFELLLSLSPSAISAGLRPLLLPPSASSSSSPTLPPSPLALVAPSKPTCIVPPLLLSLLSLDKDAELLSLLHHNPTSSNTSSSQPPLWHTLFLTSPSLDSASSNEGTTLEGFFERVRRAGSTSLSFGRRIGEGESEEFHNTDDDDEEGFVLGRWKWREGFRGLVVGWTG